MFFLKLAIITLLTGWSLQVGGRFSLIESSRVLDCNLSCSSLRRDELEPSWLLLVVELGVYPGSMTSINGRIGCVSRLCTEGTGSGGIHTSSSSFMCSWAARSKLNRPLVRETSSTSIRDAGLDHVAAGSIVLVLFSFYLANSRCLL